MDVVIDVFRPVYAAVGGVLSSPLGRWLAPPLSALVVALVLVSLPSVTIRRFAYAVKGTPFFAARLAKVALARGRRRLRRQRPTDALGDFDLALRAITDIHVHSAVNRRVYLDALDQRARAYERLEAWAEAAVDLQCLADQKTVSSPSLRAEWLRRLAAARQRLGMYADAEKVRRESDILDRIARIPATDPPILHLWPRVEQLVVSETADSEELKTVLAEVTALATLDPNDGNAAYARALLALKNRDANALPLLTAAIDLLPRDFANAYYWRARARAGAQDFEGCIDDCERAMRAEALRADAGYLQGYAHFNLGQFAAALDCFSRVLVTDPADVDAHRGVVVTRTRLSQWAEAITAADRAVEQGVRDPLVYAARGEAALNLRRLDEAIANATHALARGQDAYAYRVRAVAHVLKQEWEPALSDLQVAISSDPSDAILRAYRADVYRLQGRLAEATRDAEEAVRHGADLPFARLVHGLVELARWDKNQQTALLDSADADARWLVGREPSDAAGYWVQALVRRARNDVDGALQSANHAVQLDGTFGAAYLARAWLHVIRWAWSEAAADFRTSIGFLGPLDAAEGHLGLGECDRLAGRPREALAHYDAALAQLPTYALAHYCRGLACAALRRWAEAVASYSAALQQGLDLQDLRRSRALAYFEGGLDVEALNDFAVASAPEGRSHPLLLDWGFVLVGMGRAHEACEIFSAALKQSPASDEAYSARGWARAVAGDLTGALEDCSRAVELQPMATHANNRAWVLCKLQRWKEAVDDCNRAITLDPSYDYAFKNRSLARWCLGRSRDALRDIEELVRLRRAAGEAPATTRVDRMNWLDQARDWETALVARNVDGVGLLGHAVALWMAGRSAEAEAGIGEVIAQHPRLTIAAGILQAIDEPAPQTIARV